MISLLHLNVKDLRAHIIIVCFKTFTGKCEPQARPYVVTTLKIFILLIYQFSEIKVHMLKKNIPKNLHISEGTWN